MSGLGLMIAFVIAIIVMIEVQDSSVFVYYDRISCSWPCCRYSSGRHQS